MQQLLKIFIVAGAQSSTRQCIRDYIFHHVVMFLSRN